MQVSGRAAPMNPTRTPGMPIIVSITKASLHVSLPGFLGLVGFVVLVGLVGLASMAWLGLVDLIVLVGLVWLAWLAWLDERSGNWGREGGWGDTK